jgi:hypothetical protein
MSRDLHPLLPRRQSNWTFIRKFNGKSLFAQVRGKLIVGSNAMLAQRTAEKLIQWIDDEFLPRWIGRDCPLP